MMKENGAKFNKEHEIFMPPEVEEGGLVEPWINPTPTAYTNLDFIREQMRLEQLRGVTSNDQYVEELQDRADELRMNPPDVPEPSDPKLASSWLGTLKAKWEKKLRK